MTDSISAPQTGQIVFTEKRKPPLQAGGYQIEIEHAVANTAVSKPDDPAYIAEHYSSIQRFAVRGERFSLDPGELLGVFPPRDNQGEYHQVLPHVVFQRRTLPWERSPDLTNDGVSWLALLVLDADTAPTATAAMAGDLQRAAFASRAGADTRPSTLATTTASYADAFATIPTANGGFESYELDYGENWFDPCQVIDVPLDLFDAIAPCHDDLDWLAHVRSVGTDDKAGGGTAQDNALVVANRLPKPNFTCIVHLVSLEGMANFLPAADGTRAKALTAGKYGAIRLVSLASWQFTSVDPTNTFTGYLEGVSVDALQRPLKAGVTAPDAVTNAFELGYTAMNHATRLGDAMVSWYRGPLLPIGVTPTAIPAPTAAVIQSADQVVRLDPATGMEDVSYAAAWQIGRMLALADGSFPIALFNWKREAAIKTAQAAQQQYLKTVFAGLFPEQGELDLYSGTAQLLATVLAPSIAPAVKP